MYVLFFGHRTDRIHRMNVSYNTSSYINATCKDMSLQPVKAGPPPHPYPFAPPRGLTHQPRRTMPPIWGTLFPGQYLVLQIHGHGQRGTLTNSANLVNCLALVDGCPLPPPPSAPYIVSSQLLRAAMWVGLTERGFVGMLGDRAEDGWGP